MIETRTPDQTELELLEQRLTKVITDSIQTLKVEAPAVKELEDLKMKFEKFKVEASYNRYLAHIQALETAIELYEATADKEEYDIRINANVRRGDKLPGMRTMLTKLKEQDNEMMDFCGYHGFM